MQWCIFYEKNRNHLKLNYRLINYSLKLWSLILDLKFNLTDGFDRKTNFTFPLWFRKVVLNDGKHLGTCKWRHNFQNQFYSGPQKLWRHSCLEFQVRCVFELGPDYGFGWTWLFHQSKKYYGSILVVLCFVGPFFRIPAVILYNNWSLFLMFKDDKPCFHLVS